jgi:hypothetical protein
MSQKLILAFGSGALVALAAAWLVVGSRQNQPQVVATAAPVAAPAPTPEKEPEKQPEAPPPPEPKRTAVAPKAAKPPAPAKAAPVPTPAPEPARPAAQPAPIPPTPVITNAEPPRPAVEEARVHHKEPKEEAAPAPAPRQPRSAVIPAGTMITVRLRETLTAERSSADDPFQATLDAPLIVDGLVIAERGSAIKGRISEAERSGRVKGKAHLALELTQMSTSDGQKVDIKTETFRREAESSVKGDVAKAGVAAGIGAVIGAIAGGGKGAAVGSVIGGAAGTGGVLATRGKDATLPSETRITFRLREPVTLTEKLN